MSNENRLGAETPSLNIHTTLSGVSRQEGNLQPAAETGLIRRFRGPNGQRLVLSGPVVNLARIDEQSAGLENQTPLQENFLDEAFNRMASRFRLGLTATFELGAAVLPVASTFAQVEEYQDSNEDSDEVEVEGVQAENPIISPALDAEAKEEVDNAEVLANVLPEATEEVINGIPNLEFNVTFKPTAMWLDGKGIVATDGFKVTHKFDLASNSWVELDKYDVLGTDTQRAQKRIRKLAYEDIIIVGNPPQRISNPFELDLNEAERFLKTGDASGLKSFTNIPEAPDIIFVTGGKYGISWQNLEAMKKAVKRLAELDLLSVLRQYNPSLVIVADDPSHAWSTLIGIGPGATFLTNLGVLEISNLNSDQVSNELKIIAEMRHMHTTQHLTYNWVTNEWFLAMADVPGQNGIPIIPIQNSIRFRYAERTGPDKAEFLLDLIRQLNSKLTPAEKRIFKDAVDNTRSTYSNPPYNTSP